MMGIIAGQPDIIMPKMTPAQRQRHMEIARAQRAAFPRRGRIPTDRYYQDIINAARDRGAYRRPTYGETYGQRIVDRLNGRRSSGSGNFGFRRAPGVRHQRQQPVRGKLTGPDMQRAKRAGMTPDQWLASRGGGGGWITNQRPQGGRRTSSNPGWYEDPYTPSKRRGRSQPKQRRRSSSNVQSRGKKGVHRTRDKSLPMWQRYGAESEAQWKGMSRKERGRERAKQDWERKKEFLRANPNKFRGGISMQANYRNGKFTGGFAGNKLNKKDRLEQWIRHKDQQNKRRWSR